MSEKRELKKSLRKYKKSRVSSTKRIQKREEDKHREATIAGGGFRSKKSERKTRRAFRKQRREEVRATRKSVRKVKKGAIKAYKVNKSKYKVGE